MPLNIHPSHPTLLRRSIDLQRMYRRAMAVCEPGLCVVLGENLQTLDLVITDLRTPLRMPEAPDGGRGSWRELARRQLTGWVMQMTGRPESGWIQALVQQETALLRAFERAIAGIPAAETPILRRQLPRLRGLDLDMHHLAGSASS